MPKILLIDDDANLREVLAFALKEQGHEVEARADGRTVVSAVQTFHPEVVITDLKMPEVDGMEVLRRIVEEDSSIPVILLTAFAAVEDAVEAMKLGAFDYLVKPYDRHELKLTVDQALERRRLLLENQRLRDRLREHTRKIEIVHASAAMQRVWQMIDRIAPTDATVLLTGESGTGKDVVAHALHDRSERWESPIVAVDCGAIPRDLMEAELFGYAKGAFTGATKDKPGKFLRADHGTLFLDEIGELPFDLQTKLLRVIETRQVDVVGGVQPIEVDVRLVAATNADLEAKVQAGQFRADLFHRLNVIPIRIPPLRERQDDIPALWEHFVGKYAGPATVRSTPGLVRALLRFSWPGNVRELANLCQRTVLLRSSDLLTEADLPGAHPEAEQPAQSSVGDFLGALPAGGLSLPEVERELIVRALAMHKGNRTRAAEYLGIPRHVLIYRLEKFGIG